MLIAGFYAGALTKNGEMKEDSLLMSVTNRRMFRKKPGARGLVYDKFYYILGNAELRIRTNEKKVFSNFAIVNTNFET